MERFDFNHPPFDHLNNTERLMLEKAVDIAFFNDEENHYPAAAAH